MLPSQNKRSPVIKPDIPRPDKYRDDIYSLNENGAYVLILVFLASATTIYHFIRQTLIPLLEASQLLFVFGIIGFLAAYVFREKLRMSIADGLFYNVFGVAPVAMACFLWINATCSETYTETYRIASYELRGDRCTVNLEDNVYDKYWRIRAINIETLPTRNAHIKFTFCDGVLGYRVLKNTELR